MALDILVVDDEPDIRDLICGVLEDEGYTTRAAADSDAALAAVNERRPSLVLLDVWLRGSRLDGLELLTEMKQLDAKMPIIVISGHGNIDTAVAAISQGAVDFIEKPFEAEHLLHLVARATETERLRRENEILKARIGFADELTGNSAAVNNVRATLKRVAGTGSRLLISGPAGVGKEVAARLMHNWSSRADAAFVTISAARLSPESVEEELFGTERNGKIEKTGLMEEAHGGTLFIDEVADMPLDTQGKILRVLTEQSFNRLGGSKKVNVDVRVVSATSRDLAVEIREKRFREDLFYRLNVVPVIFRCWWTIMPHASRPISVCILRKYRMKPWRRYRLVTGLVMSGNCAMSLSVPSYWPRRIILPGSRSRCCRRRCSAMMTISIRAWHR
jgi:two-component system nitrogen regulation response regulator NtrX